MKTKFSLIHPFKTRWIQHIGFWVLSFYVLVNVFKISNEIQKIDIIYTLLFHINIVAMVYINLKILIPRLLAKNKSFWYGLTLTLNLLIFSYLNIELFNHFVDVLLPNYYFISYYTLGDIIKFHLAYLLLTTLLKLSKAWFSVQKTEQKMLALKKEKINSELESLKLQINPHFLFNSLNNIHGMASKSAKKTKELVLNLSDMLRYVLYETETDRVPLKEEIDFLKNYIELQKVRMEEGAKINLNIKGDPGNKKTAPLLFLPLVENAFKHGSKGDIKNTFINIDIKIGQGLTFEIENNKSKGVDPVKNDKGIGLENIKRRLELIYPGQHHLNIDDKNDVFKVELILHQL